MSPIGIILLVAVLLGLCALVAVEWHCWEGLLPAVTKPVERGGHGVVVRTALGPQREEAAFSRRLGRSIAVAFLITAVLLVLVVLLPPFNLADAAVPSLGAILVIALLTALGQEEGSAWRSFGWALAGYVVADAAVTFGLMATGVNETALLNGVGMTVGSLGCALAVAYFVPQRTYVRQFQDGSKSTVRVGAYSRVARALAGKTDPAFVPSEGDFEKILSHDFTRVIPRGRDK